MRKIACMAVLLLCLSLIAPFANVLAKDSGFNDIPANSWARGVIDAAVSYGLVNGLGDGQFGYGRTVTRAEFAAMLCRLFGWEIANPPQSTYADVAAGQWFFGYVETAYSHGALEQSYNFEPQQPIKRSDMAVMLVKALGYGTLADQVTKFGQPFGDVKENQGYITIAHDIGMINGVEPGKFAPDNTAAREEAAAMLVRVYEKYNKKMDWLHGFYAFSSYDQRYTMSKMNAVSYGWSSMAWDDKQGAKLVTNSDGGNQWRIPDGYETIIDYARKAGVHNNLNVFMDTAASTGDGGDSLTAMLRSPQGREQVLRAITAELSRNYEKLGNNPFTGVTLDFEGLRGSEAKEGYTAFLTQLSGELKSRGLSLYVAVHPVTSDGKYFDGYDYKAIGRVADKVILMAHDYQPTDLNDFIGTDWQKNTPLTPIAEVYFALKAITDPDTGVEDKSKIAMAYSFATVGWQITPDNKVLKGNPVQPVSSTVNARLSQSGTQTGWSEVYRNPYIIYNTEAGERYFLWYEDGRSIAEKVNLARLFGVTGASVWRIGLIPDFTAKYNVWDYFVSQTGL